MDDVQLLTRIAFEEDRFAFAVAPHLRHFGEGLQFRLA